jgi:hypothetical protein
MTFRIFKIVGSWEKFLTPCGVLANANKETDNKCLKYTFIRSGDELDHNQKARALKYGGEQVKGSGADAQEIDRQ